VTVTIRTALVSAALLVLVGTAVSAQPPTPRPPAPPPITNIPPVTPPIPAPTPPTAPVPPPPPTVDQLLDALEQVQARKAELDKQEQTLKAEIRKKLEAQAERAKKLGVAPQPPVLFPMAAQPEPDRVGRIIIEGNTKTRDEKILDKLDLRPGAILKYPALEAARVKLEKAGFRDVTVEAIPNDLDSMFKDIRVRVNEDKPKPIPAPIPGPTTRG
jgi:hypothetical protein